MSQPLYDIIAKGFQRIVRGQLVQNGEPVSGTNALPVSVSNTAPLPVSVSSANPVPITTPAIDAFGNKLVVGTARDRFFDNFRDFNTTVNGNWEVLQTGPGMTITGPLGGGVAGAAPYLNISSGVTNGSMTVILSRSSFAAPIELRYQVSASQRIAGNAFRIGFLEVDDNGSIVTDTTFASAPAVLNIRNATLQEFSGTSATTGTLLIRAAASAVDTLATSFGSGFTTTPSGTLPNFIIQTTFGLTLERDRVNSRAWSPNILTNIGNQFAYDRVIPNPTRRYKLAIIVENTAVPASSTDWRIHLINLMDATRLDVSPRSAGSIDQSKSFPVTVINTPAVTVGSGQINLGSSTLNSDISLAAITTSATTTSVTPTSGISYQVNIPVTAVSGTNPTLDISVEESDDSGTNWFKVYDFPRITATGIYRSPRLSLVGNRVRYVQTVGGTSPSFTRAINRLHLQDDATMIRQLIDRTVVLTTLGSTTPSINVQNCRNLQLLIRIGAATTAPAIQLQGSDDNGVSFYNIGTPLTANANNTVSLTVTNVQAQLVRAIVTTAGAGVTADHVLVKGF